VLGGSIGPAVPPLRPDPKLFDSSDRVWHAARLFHRGLAPRIIVSGGSYLVETGQAPQTQTEAQAMRQFLVALGVPESAIVMEGKSLNTIENMQEPAPWSAPDTSPWSPRVFTCRARFVWHARPASTRRLFRRIGRYCRQRARGGNR
jgi:uncharacterized SAM-binding protein YcdF (DUF218 family)